MRTTFLAIATPVAFLGLALPTFAEPAPSAPPAHTTALSQALLQAQVDKCLADGSITAQQVHAMADKELISTLDTCGKVAAASPPSAAKPTPAVEQQAAPPVANEPGARVARSRKVVAKPAVTAGVRARPQGDANLRAAPAPSRARLDAIGGQTSSVVAAKTQPSELGVSANGHFSNFWEPREGSQAAKVSASENGNTSLESRIRSAVREFVKRREASSSN